MTSSTTSTSSLSHTLPSNPSSPLPSPAQSFTSWNSIEVEEPAIEPLALPQSYQPPAQAQHPEPPFQLQNPPIQPEEPLYDQPLPSVFNSERGPSPPFLNPDDGCKSLSHPFILSSSLFLSWKTPSFPIVMKDVLLPTSHERHPYPLLWKFFPIPCHINPHSRHERRSTILLWTSPYYRHERHPSLCHERQFLILLPTHIYPYSS